MNFIDATWSLAVRKASASVLGFIDVILGGCRCPELGSGEVGSEEAGDGVRRGIRQEAGVETLRRRIGTTGEVVNEANQNFSR